MNAGELTNPRSVSLAEAGSEWDVELLDDDMDRITRLIHERAGIVLNRQKRGMVYGRLARRVRKLGMRRFRDYLDFLEARLDGPEGEQFINALTTNLTAFFRESHHFDMLATHLKGRRGPVKIWCNAASTGEEAWSIAMTAREVVPADQPVEILATDVDTEALERARQGIYRLDEVVKHQARGSTRWFLKGQGAMARSAKVRPELAEMVSFFRLNLVDRSWPGLDGPFDAIFCRNVMIYFDKATQVRILSRFVPLLKPDGLLFTGHSESLANVSDAFRLRGRTVYVLARPVPHPV